MKQFCVYMLKCADGSYYVGHTDELEHRVAQHVDGKGGAYTAARRPVELVYTSEACTRAEAFAHERKLKGWTRAKKEALITRDWSRVHLLAKCRQPWRGRS